MMIMEEQKEKKPKRPPNKWQLFLGTCMKTKEGDMGQKVSACSVVYKDLKEKNPDKLEEIINLEKQKREQKK